MFGIPESVFIPFASILGTVFLAIVVALGQRYGRAQPTPADKQIEVAGALVDSASIKMLTVAIEAHTVENMEGRHQMRRAVESLAKLAGSIEKLADETEEMRRDNQIGRMKT